MAPYPGRIAPKTESIILDSKKTCLPPSSNRNLIQQIEAGFIILQSMYNFSFWCHVSVWTWDSLGQLSWFPQQRRHYCNSINLKANLRNKKWNASRQSAKCALPSSGNMPLKNSWYWCSPCQCYLPEYNVHSTPVRNIGTVCSSNNQMTTLFY